MPPFYQKIIAIALLFSFSLSALFIPLSVLAQVVLPDPGEIDSSVDPVTGLPIPSGGTEGTTVTPVFTGGLGGIFSPGGAQCSPFGLSGSLGSTISRLGDAAVAGIGKIFGGGGTSATNGPAGTIFNDVAGPGTSPADFLDFENGPGITEDFFPSEFGTSGGEFSVGAEGLGSAGTEDFFPSEFGTSGGEFSVGAEGLGSAGGGFDFGGISGGTIGAALSIAGSFLGGAGGAEVPVRDSVVRSQTSIIANATTKTAQNTGEIVKKECIYDPLVKIFTAILLRALTSSIIGWIQGGQGGFVANFEKELKRQLDARGGEFLNQLTGINLCGNIGAFLRISLRLPSGLRQRLECTVTDIIRNVQGFYRNFAEGGWPAFIKISLEPQNNPYGAYLIALDAKLAAEGARGGAISAEYQAGTGFRGFKVEEKFNCEMDENGEERCQTRTTVKTPGALVAHLLNKSVAVGIDWAVAADEINEAITAIINALINKLLISSFGDKGEGIFEPELVGKPRIDPGDFSNSGLLLQYNKEVARADGAIRVLDDRELKAMNDTFAAAIEITKLENKLKDLRAQLASSDPSQAPTIQTQINDTEKALADAKRKAIDARNLFELARSTKRNVTLVKSDLLRLRLTLINTASLDTVRRLAEDRITLTNLLDSFLEVGGIIVGAMPANADLQINTIQQIDEAINIGKRTIVMIDAATKGITASGKTGLSSYIAILVARKVEINQSLRDLALLRSDLTRTLTPEEVRSKAEGASVAINSITSRSINTDSAITTALRAVIE